jgi:hypothetical protein
MSSLVVNQPGSLTAAYCPRRGRSRLREIARLSPWLGATVQQRPTMLAARSAIAIASSFISGLPQITGQPNTRGSITVARRPSFWRTRGRSAFRVCSRGNNSQEHFQNTRVRAGRLGSNDGCNFLADCPDESRQFTRDCCDRHRRHLASGHQSPIPTAQPHLRLPGNLANTSWCTFNEALLIRADAGRMSVAPRALHQCTASPTIAGLGDGSALDAVAS